MKRPFMPINMHDYIIVLTVGAPSTNGSVRSADVCVQQSLSVPLLRFPRCLRPALLSGTTWCMLTISKLWQAIVWGYRTSNDGWVWTKSGPVPPLVFQWSCTFPLWTLPLSVSFMAGSPVFSVYESCSVCLSSFFQFLSSSLSFW